VWDNLSVWEKDNHDDEFDDVYLYDINYYIRGNGVKLEMSRIHEMDANGGLTLDECNG
jgi:hypothetical protein